MNKHKQNDKNGFHHIKLVLAELIFSSLILTLFASPSYLGYWFLAIVTVALAAYVVHITTKLSRQIPTLLGYTDLASEKTKATAVKTKTAMNNTQVPKKSLRYVNY